MQMTENGETLTKNRTPSNDENRKVMWKNEKEKEKP